MKVTSQKQPRRQRQLQHVEEKLNNINMFIVLKKAGLIACLFYFTIRIPVNAQNEPKFSAPVEGRYSLALNLEFSNARQNSTDSETIEEKYVATLSEVLELLLTEDPSLFSTYEHRFEDRLFRNGKTNDEKFLLAEMNLQWAFVYLKFGHELDAASHFREAYKIAMECRKKAPHYIPIRKTSGMLEVMVGAVPQKYTWVMDLFGMRGSISNGLADLDRAGKSQCSIAKEAVLIKSLIEGYVLQKPGEAAADLQHVLRTDSSKSVALAAASLYIKSAQSEKAISLLDRAKLSTPIAHYFLGEVLLHKGEYDKAVQAYQRYISGYKGINNLKDAWFKTAMCYHLQSKSEMADSLFAIAKEKGKDVVEADRSAAKTMASATLPNIVLTKARYFTDGGYYEEARATLSNIGEGDLKSKRDKVEYYYRKARLEHGTKHLEAAKIFYQQVIDMAGEQPWYFAPNACLQMGYIFLDQNNEARSKEFFRKALSYKNHEYKNSIDSKAKTALNRLRK
jgi:tetratricopeptide (TPR) repeat protein